MMTFFLRQGCLDKYLLTRLKESDKTDAINQILPVYFLLSTSILLLLFYSL